MIHINVNNRIYASTLFWISLYIILRFQKKLNSFYIHRSCIKFRVWIEIFYITFYVNLEKELYIAG